MRIIDLDPLTSDLDQRLGQIAIEVVGLAAGSLIALCKDLAEVIEPYQIAETSHRIRRDAALDQRRDRGMDLIVSFLGSKPSSSDEERLERFFSHRLTP